MSIKKEKEKISIDNVTYKTDKEKKQEKNNIKVATIGLTQLEKLKLRNKGYSKQVEDPTTIGKDFETGIMILKEIAKEI
jgi:hypothetical protein